MTAPIRTGHDMIEARAWAMTDLELSGKSPAELERRRQTVAERLASPLSRTEAARARGESWAVIEAMKRAATRRNERCR